MLLYSKSSQQFISSSVGEGRVLKYIPLIENTVGDKDVLFLLVININTVIVCAPGQPGKSEAYLEAIRKNIEWLKKHNKEEGKDGETHELETYN